MKKYLALLLALSLVAFSGSAFVFGIVMLSLRLSREGARPFSIAAIKYVGRHTLGIFLLHKNVQLELVIPWLNSFILSGVYIWYSILSGLNS